LSETIPPAPENRREGRRRRPRRAPVFDTTVASPCISVCQIDDATGCCIGCHRSMDEIRDWPILSAEEKTAVLARLAERTAVQAGRPAECGAQDRDD
jgi:predicted Fe-S protein YdhL (DUF1289 family)